MKILQIIHLKLNFFFIQIRNSITDYSTGRRNDRIWDFIGNFFFIFIWGIL